VEAKPRGIPVPKLKAKPLLNAHRNSRNFLRFLNL